MYRWLIACGLIFAACARPYVAGPSLDALRTRSLAQPSDAQLHYELFLRYAELDSVESAKAQYKSLLYLGSPRADDEYVRLKMAELLGIEPYPLLQLTSGSRMCSQPNFFPDGQRVIFSGLRDPRSHIYMVNIDGTGFRQLTKTEGAEYAPVIMPDGQRFVFTYSTAGIPHLSMTRVGDSVFIPLPPLDAAVALPDIDRNGTRVVCITARTAVPGTQVALVNLGTKRVTYLTDDIFAKFTARFAPDGASIYYDTNQDLDSEIYRMDLATGKTKRLTFSPKYDMAPAPDPSGTHLYFVSTRADKGDIYRLTLADNRLVRITANPALETQPAVSPDGRLLAFVSDRSGGVLEVFLMDLTKPITAAALAKLLGVETPGTSGAKEKP